MHFLLLIAIGLGITGQTELPDWPPLPEEGEHVDYIKWYDDARRAGLKPEDDAFPLYRKIMPSIDDPDGKRPDKFRFSGFRHEDPMPKAYPRPWDPKQHPEWEASYQRTKKAVAQFKKAAAKPHYFLPNRFGPEARKTGPLLFYMQNPMWKELRTYSKGLSEAAWRAPNGQLDSVQFLECIRTGLGAAQQIEREPMVLSQLVGMGTRIMQYDDIRWGLRHEILNANDLKSIRQLLDASDAPLPSFGLTVRGTTALVLDVLQYVGSHPAGEVVDEFAAIAERMQNDGDTPASLGRQALRFARKMAWISANPGTETAKQRSARDQFAQIEKEHPAATTLFESCANAIGWHYRTKSIQYATRLTVEIHLYRAENGDWPESLDDLPANRVQRFRIDPVSRKPFAYKNQNGKPILYSVGVDGVDDGGTHDPYWGEGAAHSDCVLWPPGEVRLIPPKKSGSKSKDE